MSELRKRARILIVAAERQRGSVSDLIVWTWERWPEVFGLDGYRDSYPHAQSVRTKLQGAEGLIAAGLIRATSPGFWEITEEGRTAAAMAVLLGAGISREVRIDLDDLDAIDEPVLEDEDGKELEASTTEKDGD